MTSPHLLSIEANILQQAYGKIKPFSVIKKESEDTVNQWSGKLIHIPSNMTYAIGGIDTIKNFQIPSHLKILVYVDSSGCTPCKLKFEEWKIFSHSLDLVNQKKIDIIFYLNTQDHLLIKELATINKISFPLCFDEEDKFNRLNQLSKDFFFQTFLLDEMNRVILVGNPLLSDKMRELYLETVNEYSPQ